MRPYAADRRQKVLPAVDTRQGSSPTLARICGVSVSGIHGVVRRRLTTGHPHGGLGSA